MHTQPRSLPRVASSEEGKRRNLPLPLPLPASQPAPHAKLSQNETRRDPRSVAPSSLAGRAKPTRSASQSNLRQRAARMPARPRAAMQRNASQRKRTACRGKVWLGSGRVRAGTPPHRGRRPAPRTGRLHRAVFLAVRSLPLTGIRTGRWGLGAGYETRCNAMRWACAWA